MIKESIENINYLSKNIDVDFNDSSRTGHNVLIIKNLNLGFQDKQLLQKAQTELYYKEKVCLIGENGSGKTTLIKLITGVLPAPKGTIFIDGEDIRKYTLTYSQFPQFFPQANF